MSRDGDYVAESIYSPFTEDTGATRDRSSRRRGNTRTKKARIARMYVRILTEMCMNRFKWEGLPDSIDPRFLEWTLFRDALSVFYFDKEFDQYMALRASGRDGVNFYDNPTGFTAYGNQVFSKHLKADECVPIWANYMRLPDIDVCPSSLTGWPRPTVLWRLTSSLHVTRTLLVWVRMSGWG